MSFVGNNSQAVWEFRGVRVPISHSTEPTGIDVEHLEPEFGDRKSTRLNSSHSQISYAVFCLNKRKPSNLRPSGRFAHPYSTLRAHRLHLNQPDASSRYAAGLNTASADVHYGRDSALIRRYPA